MKSNRLQFVHHDEIFNTREEALSYVKTGVMQFQHPSLYGEPMVLKYKSKIDGEPNIILAIGSVGDGTPSQNNKTFFIDTADIQNSINEIIDTMGGSCADVAKLKELFDNVIASCGLSNNGTYESDANDDILKAAKSLYEADAMLSSTLQDEIKRAKAEEAAITIKPTTTDSISLQTNRDVNGTVLSADVKLSPNKVVGKTSFSNIILQEANGLFANVEVRYESNKLIVSINGDTTEYDLPSEVHLESGIYDKASETIILTLNNGKTVSIDVADLLDEIIVSPNQTSPIVLSKTRSVSGVDELSADVKISKLENNILEKIDTDEDGKFALYVNGQASNLKCLIDGKPSTIQDAIDKSINKVSKLSNNIISEKSDGIYASVGLNYDPILNVLSFDDGVNESKKIQLNSTSVLERVYYSQGEIILVFRLANGTTSEVKLNINDIVNDFIVDNTGKTITLVRAQKDGQYLLSGDVNVSTNSDNILQVDKHSLYVKGTASNIKIDGTSNTVADVLNKLNGTIETEGSIRNLINKEAEARKTTDNTIQSELTQEISRSTQFDASITNKLELEITRAKKAESDNTALIEAETERATKAEEKNSNEIGVLKGSDTIDGSVLNSIKKNNASLVYSDTEVANHYVSSVSEASGKISVTRCALPDYSNIYEPIGKATNEIAKLNSTVSGETATRHIGVEIVQNQGKLASVSINDNDIASEKELQKEIARSTQADADVINIINGITLVKRPDNDLCYSLMVNDKEQGTINIPKDQFLKDVIYNPVSHVMKFGFVTNTGERIVNVDMSELVDVYLAGDGLEFNSTEANKLQIKLNPASEAQYISVDSGGILLTGIKSISQKATDNAAAISVLNGSSDGSVKKSIESALSQLSVEDDPIEGQYISSISQSNGKISITRSALPVCTVTSDNKGNSPVNLTVVQQPNGETIISGALNVSREKGNLITADNGTVYASDNAVNHYGVYRANKKSMQEILNTISSEIDNASGGGSSDPALANRVKALEESVSRINARIDELEKQIQATGDYGEYTDLKKIKLY